MSNPTKCATLVRRSWSRLTILACLSGAHVACSDDAPPASHGAPGGTGAVGAVAGMASAGAGMTNGGSAGSLPQSGGAGAGGASGQGGASAGGAGSGGAAGAGGSLEAGASGAGTGGGGTAGAATGGAGNAGAAAGTGGADGGTAGGGNGGVAGVAGESGAAGATGGNAGASGAAGAGGTAGAGYAPCPETGPCKIMPFGDSITEGYPVYGGYRVHLFELAREADQEITFVGSATNGPNTVDGVDFPRDHEGHGGYTIDTNAARGTNGISPFVVPSMNSYEPDIITLMIGTNDLNGNIDVQSAPTRLGALLDSIYAVDPNVLVVLAQIVPTRSDGTNQVVQTYNEAMPELISSRTDAGRHLILVDMYEAFTRDADYKTALLGDNLHPNEAGYARMAETWYDVLSPYLR